MNIFSNKKTRITFFNNFIIILGNEDFFCFDKHVLTKMGNNQWALTISLAMVFEMK